MAMDKKDLEIKIDKIKAEIATEKARHAEKMNNLNDRLKEAQEQKRK